jgi:hypothetical protein
VVVAIMVIASASNADAVADAAAKSAYDYVLQIKDGTSKHIKLFGSVKLEKELGSVPPSELDPVINSSSTSICMLGPYDAGKTFVTNSLLGTRLASGTNYSTVGVSWKTAELNFEKMRMHATVYDFAGFGLPANTADGKRRLAFTEYLLDDVAAQLSCLPVIVVPSLTEVARQYIDALVDHIYQVKSQRIREATKGKSSLKELDVVVVVNNRLATSNEQLYQEMTMTRVPLEPIDERPVVHSSVSEASDVSEVQRLILQFARRTESVKWRASQRMVKFHVAYLRNVDEAIFSTQLLTNARELILRQARSQPPGMGTTGSIMEAVNRSLERLSGTSNVEVMFNGTGASLNETLVNSKGAASASAFANPIISFISNTLLATYDILRGGSSSSSATGASTESHLQYYQGTFQFTYDGNPVSWQFRYGVGTQQVGESDAARDYDVFKVDVVAPGCGNRQTAFETDDHGTYVKVSCTLKSDDEWTQVLAASPVGRSEWLIDYYEGYPFCPERTRFNNGIISIFFATAHACSLIGGGERKIKGVDYTETHVDRDSKGSQRTQIKYRHPGDVVWTERVEMVLSQRTAVVRMLITTTLCVSGAVGGAISVLARICGAGNGAVGFSPRAGGVLLAVAVPVIVAMFVVPNDEFDRIAPAVMWAHGAVPLLRDVVGR